MTELARVDTGEILAAPNGHRNLLSVARRALVEASELPHFADLVARAEVIRVAARAAGLSTDAQDDWTRYKVDCERAGAVQIKAMRDDGELTKEGQTTKETGLPSLGTLGIQPQRAAEWAKLAELTEEELDAAFADLIRVAREEAGLAGKARRPVAEHKLIKLGAGKQTKARREASRTAAPLTGQLDLRIGDARGQLKDVPDESVALVLTDPPYGDEAYPLYDWLGEWSARVLVPGGSLICYTGQSRLDRDMDLLGAHLRYWWLLAMLHNSSQRLPGKFVVAEFKPVLWYVKSHRRGRSLVTDVLRPPTKDKTEHDWGQGEGGAQLLIEHLSDPGELVADPFAGSGRWGLLSQSMGRRWVGADIKDGGSTEVVA